MNDNDEIKRRLGIRSGWRAGAMLMRGPLTDKKIEQYRKEGWYSSELKEARREMQARRAAKREGNFIQGEGGRMIYSPK